MVSFLLALRVKELVIHNSPWITIFWGSYYHCTAPISRHAHGYWSYDTSFYVLPKGLSYWFLEVEGHRNWVMPGFRDCPLFEMNMGSRAGHGWKYPSLLNVVLASFSRSQLLSLPMLSSVAGKGGFWERFGY